MYLLDMSSPAFRPPRGRGNRTRFAVLGMLAGLGPASGYELRRRIEESIGHFWQESFGQLYPVLTQLAEDGLVTRAEPASDESRGRTEYAVTDAGRAALAQWLRLPPVRHVERNELLIKVFFAALGDLDDCLAYVADSQAEARRQLRQLRETERTLSGLSAAPDHPLWTLTLDYGVRGLRAHLDWCDAALTTLRALGAGPAS
jgi:DNA-binding PadR family transcriptional regulator